MTAEKSKPAIDHERPLVPKGIRPAFTGDSRIDQVLSIAMAVATEVAVLHEELDTVARFAAQGKPFSLEDLEKYVPDDEVLKARAEWRRAYLKRLLRVLREEMTPGVRRVRDDAYAELVRELASEDPEAD